MKVFLKRSLSVFLALTLIAGLLPLAFATGNNSQSNVEFGLQSSNSLGGILTDEIQTNAGAGDIVNPDDPYALIDVHVIDKTAYVEYRAQEDSTIVVGVYTEEGKLVGSGKEEAMAEASRCINCKNAQCVKGCPVSIDIPGFIQQVKEGMFPE